MKLSVGPIPLYSQLEHDLVGRIAAGFYPTGSCLPTEEQLGQQYGVSRITVRKALCALIARGLIVRRRGVGTFVVEQPRNVHAVHLGGSLDELLISAHHLSRRILLMESVRAPSEIAEAFGMQADDTVLRLELVRESEVGPVAYSEVFIRSDIQEQISLDDFLSGEPIIYVVSRKLGERIGWASQVIQPALAGVVAGKYLGVPPKTPVLRTERKYFNSSGVLMEVALLHHHPERYRYEVELLPRLYSVPAPE
jgi:GntR family transcriptional regulator